MENGTNHSSNGLDYDFHVVTVCVATVIAMTATVLGIYGNTLIFLSAMQSSKLRVSIDAVIINVSGADLVVCVVISPMFTALLFHTVESPMAICSAAEFVGTLCFVVSFFSLDILAVHRQLRLIRHLEGTISVRATVTLVASVWAFSAVYSAASLLTWRLQEKDPNQISCYPLPIAMAAGYDMLLFMVPIWGLTIVVYLVCYSFICQAVFKRWRRHRHSSSHGNNGGSTRQAASTQEESYLGPVKQTRAILTCFLVNLEIVLTVGPLFVVESLEMYQGTSYLLFQVKVCVTPLLFMHCACNPFLYAYQNNTIKRTQSELYQCILNPRCCLTRHKVAPTNVLNGGLQHRHQQIVKSNDVNQSSDHPSNRRRHSDKAVGPSIAIVARHSTTAEVKSFPSQSGVHCVVLGSVSSIDTDSTTPKFSLIGSLPRSSLLVTCTHTYSVSRPSHYGMDEESSRDLPTVSV